MKRFLSIAKMVLGWPLSVAALFFIGKLITSKTNIILPGLKDINFPILGIAIICFLVYYFLRSYLWQKLLAEKGHKLSLKETTYLWSQAEVKRYVPGNIWSFLGRTSLFSDRGVSKANIFSSLLLEVQFFLLASFFISIFAASFILYNILIDFYFLLPVVIFGIILITICFIFNRFLEKHIKIPFLFKILPNFSSQTNFNLLLIAFFYLFFYALGTYFAIISVLNLSPIYILTYTGYFVFSLFIGYISLLTPSGLGVREGVLTFGLSKFIPLNLAGFAAIFARIVLVISEVIFLTLAFIWNKSRNSTILKVEQFVKKNPFEIFLGVLILLYILYFSTASFLRYDNFYTGRFDLGNMDQTVWNTSRGRIFQLTDPNGTEIISRLAFHADFILILLAPLYKVWSDPKMLLLLQTIIVAFGAIFVFKIANYVLKSKKLSFVFSLAYLLNPSVQHANLYDFHAVTLATTFLLAAFYFLLKKSYAWFLLFAVLSAITKEQVWIIISLFGFYILLNAILKNRSEINYRKIFFGLGITVISALVFYYLVWVAIPQARGQSHFALTYYSDFGGSPSTIVKNILFSPQKTFAIIFQNGRLYYLQQLFLPLGFLPLISPFFLIFAFPDLVLNILSNNSQLHQIYFQYTATITPFLFIAAIYGLKRAQNILPKIYKFTTYYLLLTTLYSVYVYGPMPGAKNPNLDMITKPQKNKEVIENFLTRIPKRYSIAATNNVGSHLSRRQKIYTVPVGMDKADIIVFLLNDRFAQPSLDAQIKMAQDLTHNENYLEIFREGDFVAFKKIKDSIF